MTMKPLDIPKMTGLYQNEKYLGKESEQMNTTNKTVAISNVQQLNSKIIDSIIDILANNNLSIADAKNILHATSKKLSQQKVKSFL